MQTDSKFYNLLGLARRAGKIGWGHDAAFDAIKYGKAHFCILTSDASDRLKSEFQRSCSFEGRSVPLREIEKTMDEMKDIIGVRAAVLTVNDEGFAKSLKKYITNGGNEFGREEI